MPTPTIYIVRHAEKPTEGTHGVTRSGAMSPHSLSVLGWQRAGALAALFRTSRDPALQTPRKIFAATPGASGSDPEWQSMRSVETAQPLADRLSLPLDTRYGKGNEAELAKTVAASTGPVLIVWEHKRILPLVRLFTAAPELPEEWPADRFDVVLVLQPVGSAWRVMQVPQQLLAGDVATGI